MLKYKIKVQSLHKTDAACFLSAVRGQGDTRLNFPSP